MSLFESGLAFAEGIALIVSPCILPVLPLVLSASIEGGRKRPVGIILGFVLTFSLFTFASRKIINALGVNPDVIKDASLVLLAAFGCILLSRRLSDGFSRLTQGAANAGGQFGGGQGGFGSGIVVGALIGLVWTPCAGPILAAVLVQVIRQESDWQSLLVIVPFAFGAGVPMLIISLMGRSIMGKLGFFTLHAEAVRRAFAVVILLSVAVIGFNIDLPGLLHEKPMPSAAVISGLVLTDGLEKPYKAPEFTGIRQWMNGPPQTMQSLKGKVVLVDFWTYSCINCIRTLPVITGWDAKYREKGLVIVGVHAPEFEFEKNADNVSAALEKYGIHYSVALDNDLATWQAFHNRYWPAHYLIDRAGNVVYAHFGEGNYDVTENNIRYLLGLKEKATDVPEGERSLVDQTPETYLGYARAQAYRGDMPVARDDASSYALPAALPPSGWALGGVWKVEAQKIVAQNKAVLRLHFKAKKVFLVMGTASGQPVRAQLTLDGAPLADAAGKDAPNGRVIVTRNRLYTLVEQKAPSDRLLEIQAAPSMELYAFTFGN